MLLQNYRDGNGRCIAIFFNDIGVRGGFDSPEFCQHLCQHPCQHFVQSPGLGLLYQVAGISLLNTGLQQARTKKRSLPTWDLDTASKQWPRSSSQDTADCTSPTNLFCQRSLDPLSRYNLAWLHNRSCAHVPYALE